MKAWYAYEGRPEWYHAVLLLENGAAPYSHCCSHPCFMPGDLWERRAERQEQMRAAGIELEIQNNGEPMHLKDLPELCAINKNNKVEIEAFCAMLFPSPAAAPLPRSA